MRVTTKKIIDSETGKLISWRGYEYFGRCDQACSDSGTVVANDNQLAASGLQTVKSLAADASLTFGQQQGILAQQSARFNQMVTNPLGYDPATLATARTSINENTAIGAKQALSAAANFAAAHGGSDYAGGGAGAMAAQVAGAATENKAQSLGQLAMQNQDLKRQNMLTGLQGLNTVGSDYGGANSTASGDIAATESATTGAGSGALDAANQGWEDFGSVLKGVGGIAQAGATAFACVTGETLIIRANGIECRADAVIVGDELFGLSGKETVLDVEKTANVPCVHVTTRDGITITVSCSHTFACPSGGYITASDCLGKILKSERGTSLVTNVHDAGALDVLRFKLDNRHGYITNGLWSLE